MNNKIEELELKCYDIIELDPLKTGIIGCTDRIFNKQKFAELVIEECIISATTEMISSGFDSYDELTEYDRGCDDTAALIASRIKDKFKN